MSETGTRRGIYLGKDRSQQEAEERWEEVERRKETLDAIVARLNPRDRLAVRLLRDGDSLEEWVRHLGIERQSLEEQRSKVYKEKDRLKKKLKRMARNIQGG